MERIKNIVAISPVMSSLTKVKKALNGKGIALRHFFLDDGALELPEDYPILVRHQQNLGLAKTLCDGYRAALNLKVKPDLVVRLDSQEHNPSNIKAIADSFSNSPVETMFLPIIYWVTDQPRPLEREISVMIANFVNALYPIDEEVILDIYNNKFPIGFQAFRLGCLEKLLPLLEKGMEIFQAIEKKPASWGLDLLAILVSAEIAPQTVDFHFAGYSVPWAQNRGLDKIKAQKDKAEIMIKIARRLQEK